MESALGALLQKGGGTTTPPQQKPPAKDIAYPCAKEMATNVIQARKDWVEAGKPLRTDEECAAIHKLCEGCEYFDARVDRCRK
jgi:hypothetical protein